MAWTELNSTPGSPNGNVYYRMTGTHIYNQTNAVFVFADTNDLAFSFGIDVGRELNSYSPLRFPAKANTGWIDYSSGGGGSARPSSGFLYPRG